MSRVGIAHHHSAITVGGAHPTATFSCTFVSPRLMTVHPKMPLLTHPHPFDFSQGRPDPPLEGEGNSLSLRERVRVRVGIFIPLCEPQGLMTVHSKILFCHPRMPLSGIWFKTRFPIQRRTLQQAAGYRTKISPPLTGGD